MQLLFLLACLHTCRGLHSQRFEPGYGEEPQAAASSLYVRPSYGSEVRAAPVLLLWCC